MATTSSARRYSLDEARTAIAKLKEESFTDLNRLFEGGRTPSFDEIEGETASAMLAWNPRAPWWGKPLAAICFDNPLSRWIGKAFITPFGEGKTGEGFNQFRNLIKPRRFPFLTSVERAAPDQNPCLRV